MSTNTTERVQKIVIDGSDPMSHSIGHAMKGAFEHLTNIFYEISGQPLDAREAEVGISLGVSCCLADLYTSDPPLTDAQIEETLDRWLKQLKKDTLRAVAHYQAQRGSKSQLN